MNRRKLLKKLRHQHQIKHQPTYIEQLKKYYHLFNHYLTIKFLINNVLESDRLLQKKQLPQDLPELLLPDDIQDVIFKRVNAKYPKGDSRGDRIWNRYTNALPKLDKLLRSYRDYLEAEYGMWAYISAPFTADLAHFIGNHQALEVMAGNGYISKGLRQHGAKVFCTDSLEWTHQNETGKHLVTHVEKLDALTAFQKYQNQISYIIMCWSPDGVPIDWQLLQTIRQSGKDIPMIVIGEKNGATNSKQFWHHAHFITNDRIKKLNRHHRSFDLIHDHVYLVK